jgi:hypothetical protein
MVIVEALKEVKHTLRQMEDLRKKIGTHCADLDCMAPTYGSAEEQKKKVSEWLQSHHDLALNLTELKKKIQATNLATQVSIKIGEDTVTRSITEWVIRRREIIDLENLAYSSLTDRNLAEKGLRTMGNLDEGKKIANSRVRFYFDATARDEKIDLLKTEKDSIDKTLEIINATTQII